MAARTPPYSEGPLSLGLAVIKASLAPVILLDADQTVIAASTSFCDAFGLDAAAVAGSAMPGLGAGEWGSPQLQILLAATARSDAAVDAYEMTLDLPDRGLRCVVIHARRLVTDEDNIRLLVAVTDLTDVRAADRFKDNLLREKAILLQEVQHRVANSLQIIASVLMQSARKVQSEETRFHLKDAHSRVMSIATLQQQLAASRLGDVELRPYLTQLCRSISASMIPDPERLKLEVVGDDSATSGDISVSLGLIVTELVINALKHAYPGGRGGRILVSYDSDAQGWTLAVRDDGVGMPKSPENVTPGLGTSIIESLARQLHAAVKVETGKGGTTVSIVHVRTEPAMLPERTTVQLST
ncbi:histidine kinase dimerization/phosphoacceptor domain -containing protein [Brevundimonas sp.]|uniref:sensor histidine kinase n=1 Tax=Brevundimonas sp. TaxID=1871086 RepID=UPI001D3E95D2|nr:histidine kinase dimerization/phosphoacceptor domain -containing protein [Brevundimonas sp.]MBA3999994.1 histidine kinase [Brevundimonas sp.]